MSSLHDFMREHAIEENLNLVERGKSCELWGTTASEMSIEELWMFIGFLDELLEREREPR